MPPAEPPFAKYLNERVVVDTVSRYVYLGRLTKVTETELVLADADVHDLADASSSRDIYVLAARRDGIHENRREVTLRADTVMSVSRLEDVTDY